MTPAESLEGYRPPDTTCQQELLDLLEERREEQRAAKRAAIPVTA